ncbi:MAG TPA: hypothetical protein VLC93_17820 [Myxococcota bacterium]|nr:hypothetical protein [Myxococcota bacterium]
MLEIPVIIYAQAPATAEERAAAIDGYRKAAKQALATGVGELPTTTAEWIQHIDTFTLACKSNNEIAIADRSLVGPLEQQLGEHWAFGFELIRAGVEAAMEHQQAKVQSSNGAKSERVAYQHLLTSYQVAFTTFTAFGNPVARWPSIH